MFISFFCVEIVSCFNSCAVFFLFSQKSLFTGSLAAKHTGVLWPEEILDGIGKQKCLPIMLYRVQQMDLWEIIGSFKFHPFVNFTLPPAAHQCLPEPTEKPAAQQGSWITENSLAELLPLQNGGFLRRQWVFSGFPKLEASFFFNSMLGTWTTWEQPHTLFHFSVDLQRPVGRKWVFTKKSALNRASVLPHSWTCTMHSFTH